MISIMNLNDIFKQFDLYNVNYMKLHVHAQLINRESDLTHF